MFNSAGQVTMVVSFLPSRILPPSPISPLTNLHINWEWGRYWCVCVGKNNRPRTIFKGPLTLSLVYQTQVLLPSFSSQLLLQILFDSLPSNCFNPPPAFSSALKSNSHGVCSDSLFIKEMNSICIIHFFCDFFPLQGVNAPQCIGNRDSDRRRREQGGKNAFPHVAGTDRGQEVWPLLADTLSSTILSRQKEGAPCAGY